tara:strand:+ start:1774 stop:2580 length:807 start_codon:yes stop_codon:yes gene_type:complete
MAKNEVEVKQESNVIAFDASILLEDAGTASENMTADDMLIPRLKILQAQSPQALKSDGAYIKGAEAGQIFDNVTGELVDGETGMTVVPVSYRKTYLEWTDDRKLVKDHGLQPDNLETCVQDEKGKLRTPDGNTMSLTAEYFIYVVAEDGSFSPAIISMSSSGIKKAKRWNSMINRLQIPHPSGKGNNTINPAMFWTAYTLTTTPEQNDMGSWFNWEIEMKFDAQSGGIIQNLDQGQSIYLEAREFRKNIQNGEVKVQPDASSSDEIPF